MDEIIWGINPPAETTLFWGARAIIKTGKYAGIDIPWDRQSFRGDRDSAGPFQDWVNDSLKTLDGLVKEKCNFALVDLNMTLESKENGFVLKADTRQSGGYLYIGAWKL